VGHDLVHALLLDPLESGAQAGYAHGVEGAGLETIRELFEMSELGRLHAGAAPFVAYGFHVGTDGDTADADRAEQGLVAREGHHVDVHGRHVDGDAAGGLGGVDSEEYAALVADRADGGDVLHRADHVGAVVHDHQAGVGPDACGDVVGIDETVAVEGREIEADEVPVRQFVQGAQHGVVLDPGRDHMVAGLDDALDDRVETVGGVGREDQPVVVGRGVAEEGVEFLAGLVQDRPGLDRGVRAGSARIDAVPPVELVHGHIDGFGFGERRRTIVEIRHFSHNPPPISPVSQLSRNIV